MRKANVKEAINGYSDDNYITPYTLRMFMLNKIYPINSVYVSSNSDNPKNYLGGEWELIDKGFSSKTFDVSDNIATPTENVTDFKCFVVRSGHSFALRFDFKNAVEFNDSTLKLFTVDFSKLGISRMYMNAQYVMIGSDGGNGVALGILNWSTSEFTVVDVIPKGSSTTIPANSSCNVYFNIIPRYDYMLDEACDKFYWKRVN